MDKIDNAAKAAFEFFARTQRFKGLKWEDISPEERSKWRQMAVIVRNALKED
jgi:hypothetical protein